MIAKLSSEPTPRPPDTTIFADVSSGRSDAWTLSSTQVDRVLAPAAAMFYTSADPPPAAASKPAVRIVATFVLSDDLTVWIALPA